MNLIGKNLGSESIKQKAPTGSTSTQKASSGTSQTNNAKLTSQANASGINVQTVFDPSGPSILQRANKRKQIQEARKQHNIERIFALALNYNLDTQNEENIDPDWFNHFITLAEQISSPAMQELWAKILVGELSFPGTFSYKSLQLLKQMTLKEANSFQHVCKLICKTKRDKGGKVIFGYYRKPSLFNLLNPKSKNVMNLSKFGFPYTDLLTLSEVGLLYQSEIESGEIDQKEGLVLHFATSTLALKPKSNGLVLTYFKLTQTGYELSKLLRPSVNQRYLDELKQMLEEVFKVS